MNAKIIWLTGLSGAGKKTALRRLYSSQGSFASGLRNDTAKDGPVVAHGSWTG